MSWPLSASDLKAEKTSNGFSTLVSRSKSAHRSARQQPGHFWAFALTTGLLTEAKARELSAFFSAHEGRLLTFTYISAHRSTPQGAGGGTPLTNTSQAKGSKHTINTDGWPNSTTVLKAGDVIKFASHAKVYEVTADATTNGSGEVDLSIQPGLLETVPDGNAITYNNVPFTVAFARDLFEMETSFEMQSNGSQLYQFQIDLEEVFN